MKRIYKLDENDIKEAIEAYIMEHEFGKYDLAVEEEPDLEISFSYKTKYDPYGKTIGYHDLGATVEELDRKPEDG